MTLLIVSFCILYVLGAATMFGCLVSAGYDEEDFAIGDILMIIFWPIGAIGFLYEILKGLWERLF